MIFYFSALFCSLIRRIASLTILEMMSEKFLKWMFRNFFVGTESNNGEATYTLVNEKVLRGQRRKT